jgi:hypothetical protein
MSAAQKREPRSQSTVYYLALPVFEKLNVKLPKRESFTKKINKVCKKLGFTREQLGIVAKARAHMYFNGNWYPVSYDAVIALAKNGTDIIFIEKENIVQVLCEYADTYGIALVDTQGAFTDYGRDLVEEAESSGANVAVVTDFDAMGIKMAADAGDDIPRLGVDDETLEYFGLSRDTPNLAVPNHYKIDMMTRIEDLVDDDVFQFLKHKKIEIDAVLAVVGNERFWEYLMHKLQEYYPTRDLTRVISPSPDLSSFLPEDIRNERNIINEYVSSIVSEEEQRTEEELANFEGITEIEAKKHEIEKRHGAIVEKDELLKELAAKHHTEIKPILDKIVKKKEEDHQRRVKKIQEEEQRQAKEKAELIKKYGHICSKYNLEIQDIPDIGPTTARKLKELGIVSVIDLAVANADDLGPKLAAPSVYDLFAGRDEEEDRKSKSEKIKAAKENASKYIAAAKKLLEDVKEGKREFPESEDVTGDIRPKQISLTLSILINLSMKTR